MVHTVVISIILYFKILRFGSIIFITVIAAKVRFYVFSQLFVFLIKWINRTGLPNRSSHGLASFYFIL